MHQGHYHEGQSHGYSVRVQVFLNTGDSSISDIFRLSYHTNWDNFFSRVKMALCPELVPEPTDCMRDMHGAHIFEVGVLTNGEHLIFCPRGEKLRDRQQQQQQGGNFVHAAGAAYTGGFHGSAGVPYSMGLAAPGGLDFQQALGSVPSQYGPGSALSFPSPDGRITPVDANPDQLSSFSGNAVFFPSPVPPDEEPPYIPEKHDEKHEDKGDAGSVHEESHATVGNAGGSGGGNTGLAVEQKPEGALVIEEKKETNEADQEKEKAPEKPTTENQ